MPQPKIKEYIELPLDKLEITKGKQVRTEFGEEKILANNIEKLGLIHPIVVAPKEGQKGRYEIICGQRRFIAINQFLPDRKTIPCGIIDRPVSEREALKLSLSENWIRSDLKYREYTGVCTKLYFIHASVQAVADELGLKRSQVNKYIKFDRLNPEVKKIVRSGEVKLNTALLAQDALAAVDEKSGPKIAKLAIKMEQMSGPQRQIAKEIIDDNPDMSIEDVSKAVSKGGEIHIVKVQMLDNLHRSLQAYALTQGDTIQNSAHDLIKDGLKSAGLLINNV